MSLGPHDVTTIFGIRGCGKSTLTRQLVGAYQRAFIFDRLGEWSHVSEPFTSRAEFDQRWPQEYAFDGPAVYHFEPGLAPDQFSEDFNSITQAVYKTGKATGLPRVLVLEEAQFYCQPTFCEPWLFESVLTGRHASMAIIANSQRPASIHKSLVSQSTNIFVGQLFEMRDIKYLSETIGDIAFQARTLKKGDFIWYRLGEPARIVTTTPQN